MIYVEKLDHVHIEVDDREEAAAWYEKVIGLRRDARFALWAEDPLGPLALSTENGDVALTLFARPRKLGLRDATVAFRVSGTVFLTFLEYLPVADLLNDEGRPLQAEQTRDHEVSWSIYFRDPYDNRIELTTYDYEAVKMILRQ